MRRLALGAGILFAAVAPSQAYYHFVHYLKNGTAPEKFDLALLPGKTVNFVLADSGPSIFTTTDSLNSVMARIQQATAAWNDVASSDLRVSFGGFASSTTIQNTPGGDVVFEDLPPGVEGFGGPTSRADAVVGPDGQPFIPIVRSVIHLNRNLTSVPGPSFSQSFLLTAIHEMGHALGLQHTFTASAMSQDTIRATTALHPIENDDVAGLSVLYPAPNFAQTGSISGRVVNAGKGVHLASVVAMRSGAGAVSAITDRDGNYRIDGVPAGQYVVYVHALPPDANIDGPWDADGKPVPSSGAFNSLMYPGTTDIAQARRQVVAVGKTVAGIDFSVTKRDAVPVYDGQVFGYLNNNTVANRPAPVVISGATVPVAASVTGLGSNGRSPGLSVQFADPAVSVVPNGILPSLSNGFTYVYLYLKTATDAVTGPQHIIFNTPDYMYILPSALYLTAQLPPSVSALTARADGSLTVTGANFAPGMQIYFDSLPGTVVSVDTVAGSAVVLPPAGSSGQQATLVAYTPDGQNSQMWKPAVPVTYSYGVSEQPYLVGVFPSGLPAGAEGVIEIQGVDTRFAQGSTMVGFGSSDIRVTRTTVLSPTRLRVNVAISAAAQRGASDITILSGFGIANSTGVFQVSPVVRNLPSVSADLVNLQASAGITGNFPGATVSVSGSNLAQPGQTASTVTIAGRAARIVFWSPEQLNFEIPADVPSGNALLVVNNGALNSYGVDITIDPPPAGFTAIQTLKGEYVSQFRAARIGETLIAMMTGLASAVAPVTLPRIQAALGGVGVSISKIEQLGAFTRLTFTIPDNAVTGNSQRLIIYRDGLSSVPANIPVAFADGSFAKTP